MELPLKLVGIVIWPLFFITSSLLIKSSPRKSSIHSFSDLGSSSANGTKFDVLLILAGLFQIVFLNGYLQRFGLAILALMVTSFFGILSGVIRQKGHRLAHKIVCTVGFAISAPGWAVLGLQTIQLNKVLGSLLVVLGLTIIPLLLYAVFQKKPLLKYELVFFFGAFLTNLTLLTLN